VLSPERKQSNDLLRAWCAGVTGDVLSIGSGGDIDKEGSTYRTYFRNATSYTTSDLDPAYKCDLLVDVRQMGIGSSAFDTVFCSGVLEHVDEVQKAISEIHRILKDGGNLIVGVPFLQPIHRAPGDFWRVTEFGLREWLKAFLVVDVVPLGKPETPYGYWALAKKVRHG
jgi:SAM-dependent methyltransferase